MKSDKLSYLILIVEIIAITLLHSVKTERHTQQTPPTKEIGGSPLPAKNSPTAIVFKLQ